MEEGNGGETAGGGWKENGQSKRSRSKNPEFGLHLALLKTFSPAAFFPDVMVEANNLGVGYPRACGPYRKCSPLLLKRGFNSRKNRRESHVKEVEDPVKRAACSEDMMSEGREQRVRVRDGDRDRGSDRDRDRGGGRKSMKRRMRERMRDRQSCERGAGWRKSEWVGGIERRTRKKSCIASLHLEIAAMTFLAQLPLCNVKHDLARRSQ
eukprot:756825-Hanusia_phi.AAC.4